MMCPWCGVEGDVDDYLVEEDFFVTCLNCKEGVDLFDLVVDLQDQITRIIKICEENW